MIRFFIFLLVFVIPVSAYSEVDDDFPSLNTPDVVERTLECTDCIDWKLEGVCFWLKCVGFYCSVKPSIKVGHYIPELSVSTYTTTSVWEETRSFNDTPPAAMAQTDNKNFDNTPVDFKHADIFVNPTLMIWNDLMGRFDWFCKSPLGRIPMPVFLSDLDPMWRDPTIERLFPQSMFGWPRITTDPSKADIPLVNGYWAPEYPRCGWGAHPYDAINAAVAAHRAAHIVTRKLQPHLYFSAKKDCARGEKCWPPSPVSSDEQRDNRFQMLYPVTDDSASAFGGSAKWAYGRSNDRETYMWTLWRRYECCKDRGSFLFDINF